MIHRARRGLYVLIGTIVIVAVTIGVSYLSLKQKWVQDRLGIAGINYYLKAMLTRRAFVNEPGLKVILCGTSSPQPNRERAGTCTAIVAGGRIFLVDVGGGGWRNMMLWKMPADLVAGVLLTHFHSDHIQDLGEVNTQTWSSGRLNNLVAYGGPGIKRVVAGFMEAYSLDQTYRTALSGDAVMPQKRFTMIAHTISRQDGTPLKEGETSVVLNSQGLKITAIGVNHFPAVPAYAYRFDYQGRSVVISGDTRASIKFAEAVQGCDVLIHEAQQQNFVSLGQQEFSRAGQNRLSHISSDIQSFHTSPIEAAEIANKAGAKLLILTHLTPPLSRFIAKPFFLIGVDKIRAKGIIVGYDGLVVHLRPGIEEPILTDID